MKKRMIIVGLASLGILAGCSSEKQGPEGTQSVKWYVEHAPQMRKELAWCDNQAARKQRDGCKNANAALNKNAMNSALGGEGLTGHGHGKTPAQIFDNYHP